MGLTTSIHRFIELIGGVCAGSYRAGYFETRPPDTDAKNENGHYLLSEREIATWIDAAATSTLDTTTYPIALWIDRFSQGISNPVVCDFGGRYGHDFHRISRLLPKPARWVVCEIPEIVRHAKQVDALSQVSFTDTAPTADIFYSNGVVMNADGPLFSSIEASEPKSLIITGVECVDGNTFYTWQVLRKAGRKCIYVTYNRAEFVAKVEAMGYRLLDQWRMGKSGSGVFLKSGLNVDYFGFAFKRQP